MRTSLFLLAGALILAACDDAAESTAPRSRSTAAPVTMVSPAQVAELPPGPTTNLRPSAGFTTVLTVESPVANILQPAINTWAADATCPAGSTLIGGGYRVLTGYMDLHVSFNQPNGQNGWRVTGTTSVSNASFVATAICVK